MRVALFYRRNDETIRNNRRSAMKRNYGRGKKSDAPRPKLKRHEFLNDGGIINGQSIKFEHIHM